MKIIEQTPNRLELRSIPWLMGLILCFAILWSLWFGLQALGTGDGKGIFWGLIGLPTFLGLALVALVRRDELVLDRDRNLVELRHSTFIKRQRVQHQLQDLERALVESNRRGKGTPTHRVALIITTDGDAKRHPITPVYSGGTSAQTTVETINAWLGGDVDSPAPQA